MKRERKGSRIVLLRPDRRFLLLHFAYRRGPLAGTDYWGLPGGGHEPGETPSAAAVRELREETGLVRTDVGPILAESRYDFTLSTGETVLQHDYYFLVGVEDGVELSRDGLTAAESDTLAEVRWWSPDEARRSGERIMPGDLARVLSGISGFSAAVEKS